MSATFGGHRTTRVVQRAWVDERVSDGTERNGAAARGGTHQHSTGLSTSVARHRDGTRAEARRGATRQTRKHRLCLHGDSRCDESKGGELLFRDEGLSAGFGGARRDQSAKADEKSYPSDHRVDATGPINTRASVTTTSKARVYVHHVGGVWRARGGGFGCRGKGHAKRFARSSRKDFQSDGFGVTQTSPRRIPRCRFRRFKRVMFRTNFPRI